MTYDTSTVLRRDARGRGTISTPRSSEPLEIANVEFVTDYVATAVSGIQPGGGGQPTVVAGDIRFASQTPVVGTSGLPRNLGPSDYGKAYVALVDDALRVYVWTGYVFVHLGADLSAYVLKEDGKVLSDNNFTTALKNRLESITPELYVLKDGSKVLSDNNFTTELKNKLESIGTGQSQDVDELAAAVAGLSGSVASVSVSVQQLASEQSRLSESVDAAEDSLASLGDRVSALEGGGGEAPDISGLQAAIQELSDSVYTKQEVDRLLAGVSGGSDVSVRGTFDMRVPGDFYRLVVAVGRALGATVVEGDQPQPPEVDDATTPASLAAGVIPADTIDATTPIGLASRLGISYNDGTTLFQMASSIEGT